MRILCSVNLTLAFWLFGSIEPARAEPVVVSPAKVLLESLETSQQLLVSETLAGRQVDRTGKATYQSANPNIATVGPTGRVHPVAEGTASITVVFGGSKIVVPVEVSGIQNPRPVSFQNEIVPILTKARCNSGGCHGKAEGQNGFKLSVFSFDPAADYAALAKEARGRRVVVGVPDRSLFLLKASGRMPHGGGNKVRQDGLWYQRIQRWIEEGAPFEDAAPTSTVQIEVQPTEVLIAPGESQQLQVTAIDSNGKRRCVTAESEFQTNADQIAGVDEDGLINVSGVPGEAAILVRYMGHVTSCRVTLPQTSDFKRPAAKNFVDKLVWDRLERLGIQPSELCDDATFLRRVSLDLTGTLPTADRTRAFLDDKTPEKRALLIEQLFDSRDYADYQAMRWADILRVDKDIITAQGAVAMTRWLRRQFVENTPYNEFAKSIILAKGNTLSESPTAFYQAHTDAEAMGRSVSQLFLGVRIECAQCHHHPFEHWGQEDYFAFAGFFSGVTKKSIPSGGSKVVSAGGTDLLHPRTQQPLAARGLGAEPIDATKFNDRREALAAWMIAKENPFFARMIANRLWAHYFGRGLVEPIDDMRETNPATNEPLLKALAENLVETNYDLRKFTTTLLQSQAYQLSSAPNESNRLDEQNFSHASWKAMPAEVLLDGICQATDIAEDYQGWPRGYRAIQIWDNRMPSYFFQVFGRPARVTVCECERGNEPSMAQALHLLNAVETSAKIEHRDGRARRLANSELEPAKIIEELFLATINRLPTDEERKLMLTAFESPGSDRQAAAEDVLWALLNMKEFLYNH